MVLYRIIRKMKVIIGLILLLLIEMNISCKAQEGRISDSKSKSWLVQKIDPSNVQTFAALKNVLEGKKIVLLGEKNHNDGSTLKLKVDLIKYLHDSLGFNILLIENGIYDTYRAWKDILEKKDSTVGVFAYLFHLFPNIITEENIQFARYLDHTLQTKNPLVLNGLDITGGTMYHHAFYLELEELLKKLSSGKDSLIMSDYVKFSLKGKRKEFNNSQESLTWMKSLNLDSIKYYGNRLIEFLEQKRIQFRSDSILSQREIPLFIQSIHSDIANYPYTIDATGKLLEGKYGKGTGKDRDEFIAENVFWYIEKYYPGQKFIISMATFHTTKDLSQLRDKYEDFKDIKPLGEFLYDKYFRDIYSICFVNYGGKRRNIRNYDMTTIPSAPKGSIERVLHESKTNVGFLNIGDSSLYPIKFRNKSLSPIFDSWYFADWSKVYDGIIFIDQMEPANIKLLPQRTGMKQPYNLPKEYYAN